MSSVPGKSTSCGFDQFERLDVQVVRRLVEHEHVGRAREQPREQQPVALAARQRLDGRPRALGRKEEVLEVAVDVARDAADRHRVAAVGHRVDDGSLGIELRALLIEVRDLDVRALPHLAAVGLELADQHVAAASSCRRRSGR